MSYLAVGAAVGMARSSQSHVTLELPLTNWKYQSQIGTTINQLAADSVYGMTYVRARWRPGP